MLTLHIYCGLPGSGKSTAAKKLGLPIFEADQYFIQEDGSYEFDPSKLRIAHETCQNNVRKSLQNLESCIVANTFSQQWEAQPYINMAKDLGANLVLVDLFDNGCTVEELFERNVHGVPLGAIKAMKDRWEDKDIS